MTGTGKCPLANLLLLPFAETPGVGAHTHQPGPGELPPEAAADVVPLADVVAITGTSLLNKTFDHLIQRCRRDAFVMVLGPTTPLSPVLFDYGVDLIAGTLVTDPQLAIALAGQGAIFRQMRGVRLVTLGKGS